MGKSPLRRLPAELRNKIYELALSASGPISGRYSYKDAAWTFDLTFKYGITLGITQTCRQIYEESKSLVFLLNTFEIKTISEGIDDLWVRFREEFASPQLSAMRSIFFDIEDECCGIYLGREKTDDPLLELHGILLVVRVSEEDESKVNRKVMVHWLKGRRPCDL